MDSARLERTSTHPKPAELRSQSAVLLALVFFFAAALGSVSKSLLFVTLFAVIATSCGAVLSCLLPYGALLTVGMTAAACGLSGLLSGNWYRALAIPVFCVVSLIIGLGARAGSRCSATVVRSTVFLTLLVFGLLAGVVFYRAGTIRLDAIGDALQNAYQMLLGTMKSLMATIADGETELPSDIALAEYARTILLMFPAVTVFLSELFAFLCAKLFARTIRALDFSDRLSDRRWLFEYGPVSAVVFLLMLPLSAVFAALESELLGYTAETMLIILMPGFAVIGLRAIRYSLRRSGASGASILLRLALFAAVFILFQMMSVAAILLLILSILGAVHTIRRAVRKIRSSREDN